ncbi:MAG: hypothetical protein U0835_19800 [Isosphaeraceae bacterium]
MPEPLSEVIARVIRRVVELAQTDEALRADLHVLAEEVLGATTEAERPVPLTFGQADPETHRPSITLELSHPADQEDSLDGLEARLREKARGARDAASRQSGFGAGLDLEEAQADTQEPLHAQAAGCYDAAAEALSLVRSVSPASGDPFRRSLHLLVEAQSGLRAAIRALQRPDDPDQRAVYELARDLAAQHQVFIRRYMRADDLADPRSGPTCSSGFDRSQRPCPAGNARRPRSRGSTRSSPG